MTNTTVSLSSGPALIHVEAGLKPYSTPRVRIETLDFQVLVRGRSYTVDGQRGYHSATRAYGTLNELLPASWADRELDLLRAAPVDARCPVLARHQREGVRDARVALLALVPAIVEALAGLGWQLRRADHVTASWSRKAGCSMCACSPGFVLSDTLMLNGVPVDLHFG